MSDAYKPPFMPWFEADFISSFRVRRLRPLARLMYRSLLQQGWRSDNPPYLPANDETLALMADATPKEWARHKLAVLSMFTRSDDGEWYFHPKAVELYQRVQAEHLAKQRGGRRGGRGRATGKQEDSNSGAEGELKDSPSNQNQNYNQSQSPEPEPEPEGRPL